MYELASVIILGIIAQWVAWKNHVPAILPLIIIGLIVGPGWEYLYGYKLIDPNYNEVTKQGIFAGDTLHYVVSLAIGIILFEGGLTLKMDEFKQSKSSIIRLITIGSLVTLVGGAIATKYILGIEWQIAVLFAALIVVTGPTVIAPILRNVPLNKNVAAILKWEGILIDPIGALLAVLAYEFIEIGAQQGEAFTITVLMILLRVVIIGTAIGVGAARAMNWLIKKDLIPHYLLNPASLAFVLSAFALSDLLEHESGLVAVVVMGMTLANSDVPKLKSILDFKESITILLISILFILLSANMSVEQLSQLGLPSLALFAVIILVLRPLGVFLSTYKSDLSNKEKLFISWVGPRGIVAAGIASLISLRLANGEHFTESAELLAPLVFMVVLGTVLLNATTARPLAKYLQITLDASNGILIVGANSGARLLAQHLQSAGEEVTLVDSSEEGIKAAKAMGLEVIHDNIYNHDLEEHFELLSTGYLLAMTSNDDVNRYACKEFWEDFGENGTFKLIAKEEKEGVNTPHLFSGKADFLKFNHIARSHPNFHKITIATPEHFEVILTQLDQQDSLPVYLDIEGLPVQFIHTDMDMNIIVPGTNLVYFGEVLEEIHYRVSKEGDLLEVIEEEDME